MTGFFDTTIVASKKPASLIPKCGACGLLNSCKSPKMPVSGKGGKGILLIGEAPGAQEDEEGRQFVGKTGRLLRDLLNELGLNVDKDCWLTNALVCRPPDNATPTDNQIDYCRPILTNTVKILNPRLIIPLGFTAMKSFIAPYFRGEDEGVGSISTWAGWKIPLQKINTWVCPTFHPSFVARAEEDRNGPVVKLWWKRHLEDALALLGRPWDVVPDWKSEVEIELDHEKAARWIRKAIEKNLPTAYDYETNCLKPDRKDAEIVTVGFSVKGKRTMACPFVGDVIDATREFLVSPVPKIGAHNKFEERWSQAILGVEVKNWVWDTMQSAHHLDNRKNISSVKFQGFVRLGMEPWDGAVRPYLEAPDAVSLNRIKEADLRTTLLYNGIDSLVEYKIAEHQKEEMKWQNHL